MTGSRKNIVTWFNKRVRKPTKLNHDCPFTAEEGQSQCIAALSTGYAFIPKDMRRAERLVTVS